MHAGVEVGFLGRRRIFTVLRYQRVRRVGQSTAYFVISEVDAEIVDENVGLEFNVLVYQSYFLALISVKRSHFGDAVEVELVGVYEQSVALLHAHVAESVHRFGFRKVMAAVALHYHGAFGEYDIPDENHERILGIFLQRGRLFEEYPVPSRAVGRRNHGPYFRTLGRGRKSSYDGR